MGVSIRGNLFQDASAICKLVLNVALREVYQISAAVLAVEHIAFCASRFPAPVDDMIIYSVLQTFQSGLVADKVSRCATAVITFLPAKEQLIE